LVLAAGVFVTGAYSRKRGHPPGDSPAQVVETAPIPARPTASSPPDQAASKTTTEDLSGLTSALERAISSSGEQPSVAAMTAFELKELAVKIVFVSDQQADALGALGLPAGAVVMEVGPGPALGAGLHAGDVITTIAGAPIKSKEDLRRALRRVGPGKTRYGISRDTRDLVVEIECAACKVS
jgi:S1-C subfamily serine protease